MHSFVDWSAGVTWGRVKSPPIPIMQGSDHHEASGTGSIALAMNYLRFPL